jgi:hypothetical protein
VEIHILWIHALGMCPTGDKTYFFPWNQYGNPFISCIGILVVDQFNVGDEPASDRNAHV